MNGVSERMFSIKPLYSGIPPDPNIEETITIRKSAVSFSSYKKTVLSMNNNINQQLMSNNTNLTQVANNYYKVGLFKMNNISFEVPGPSETSWLEQTLSGKAIKNENLGPNIIHVKKGDVVQFILNNGLGGTHPFHLHGHWMW